MNFGRSFAADPHEILSAQLVLDGKPDADLEQKATVFEITQARIGGGIGPYFAYLCYDAENFYVACLAEYDVVSCHDDVSADFMSSDYIRFYVCVDEDFKGRQALNGDTDWAIIFTPRDTDDNWTPMVREDPYNGPGHGAIEGDDITTKRFSSETDDGWYLEAAVSFSLLGTTYDDLSNMTFGVYFIAGDTDESDVRTGEMSLAGPGAGNYWNSPDFWQESVLGEFMAVDSAGKLSSTWGLIKNFK
jgi:hypothetical protein